MSQPLDAMMDNFSALYNQATRDCGELERHPGYFKVKKIETLLVVDKSGFKEKELLLEIGCGTGFQSSLLASCCGKVISTDLQDFSKATHTIGIRGAKEMSSRLGISNIEYLSCSALNLPFKEKSFGCVFASSVLEHVENKTNALLEIKRVLKDDGILVCIIPTFMESLFQFPSLYLYIIKRTFDVIKNKLLKKKVEHKSILFNKNANNSERAPRDLVNAFFRNNPSFPFPEPHGDWRNKKGKQSIFIEFTQQFPWKWNKMFLSSGLRIEKTFAVLFIPYRMIEIFSPRLLTTIYSNTQFLHKQLADSFLKHFSVSMCYVINKAERNINTSFRR